MKMVLFVFGLLGLATVFGTFEPTPVCAEPVTSNEVKLVSEQMAESSDQPTARQRNGLHRNYKFLGARW